MEVILLERIPKLGQMGDLVNVKPGYARNYLLPRLKAMRATNENKKVFETKKIELEAKNLKLRSEAESVAKKMGGVHLIAIRQAGEKGQLYGGVNRKDVAKLLAEKGFSVDPHQVDLAHIKEVGSYLTTIHLHVDVNVKVDLIVARSLEEAENMRQPATSKKSEKEKPSEADEIITENDSPAAADV